MSEQAKAWDVGAGGAVVRDGRVLLVRKTYGKGRGRWSIPGGFAEHEERLDETAVREVFEETGVRAAVESVVAARTCYREAGGAVYLIFKLRYISGEPVPDGGEIDGARFFSEEEILALEAHQTFDLSRHAALAALRGGEGLVAAACAYTDDFDYLAFIAPDRSVP